MNKKNPTNIQSTDVVAKSTQELEKIIATELESISTENKSVAELFSGAASIGSSLNTACGEPYDQCEQKDK